MVCYYRVEAGSLASCYEDDLLEPQQKLKPYQGYTRMVRTVAEIARRSGVLNSYRNELFRLLWFDWAGIAVLWRRGEMLESSDLSTRLPISSNVRWTNVPPSTDARSERNVCGRSVKTRYTPVHRGIDFVSPTWALRGNHQSNSCAAVRSQSNIESVSTAFRR